MNCNDDFEKMTLKEKQRCLEAVDSEPEFPDEMPDEIYFAIKNGDKTLVSEILRWVVRETKRGIRERIIELKDFNN